MFVLTTQNCFDLIPSVIPKANGSVRTGSGRGR